MRKSIVIEFITSYSDKPDKSVTFTFPKMARPNRVKQCGFLLLCIRTSGTVTKCKRK